MGSFDGIVAVERGDPSDAAVVVAGGGEGTRASLLDGRGGVAPVRP